MNVSVTGTTHLSVSGYLSTIGLAEGTGHPTDSHAAAVRLICAARRTKEREVVVEVRSCAAVRNGERTPLQGNRRGSAAYAVRELYAARCRACQYERYVTVRSCRVVYRVCRETNDVQRACPHPAACL